MRVNQPRLPAIADLNRLSAAEFARAIRPLFEAAGPLAEALYEQRPYASYDDLITRAEFIAARLPINQQVELVNAHPRIGENPTIVSSLSYREQGYDRDASLPVEDVERVSGALAE